MENNELRHQRASSQVLLGLLVIGLGVLFLLDNLDILDFRHALGFWPLAFIIAGLVAMFGNGPRSGNFVGAILVGIGVLMTLGRLGYLYINWSTLWPLVMIALGGMVLYRSLGPGRVARRARVDGSGRRLARQGRRQAATRWSTSSP
jgi:hypothetical protein